MDVFFLTLKKPMLLCSLISPEAGKATLCGILMTGETMKSFLERLAGGRRSFRDLDMGETAALSLRRECGGGKTPP